MKKIVALGAIAALAGGMIFADEPAIDIKVAELSGNAEVKWGVDLDAGQHGFTNKDEATLKVNLWNEGTKETSGDGIWADIQVKGKALALKNKAWDGDGNATLERAKLHFGPNFYVDIKSGNTTVGEFKPDTAVHSDKAYLSDDGINFPNGIQVGFDADAFKFSLDFRSQTRAGTDYTSAYGIEFDAGLKDNLVPGLTVDLGFGMNLSTDYKDCVNSGTDAALADHTARILDWDKGLNRDHVLMTIDGNPVKDGHSIAYAAKAAYKIAIGDDGLYIKPSVGYRGSLSTGTALDKPYSQIDGALAGGLLFGWGDINKDAKCGVPFLDGDETKKVSPGIGVVAYVPLVKTTIFNEAIYTAYSKLQALIVPSFYLGDKVTGLNAAAYSEIGIYNYTAPEEYVAGTTNGKLKSSTDKNIIYKPTAKKNETVAFALAAGVSYAIPVDEAKITPKAGFRFVNGAYVANGLKGAYSDIFKTNLGLQRNALAEDTVNKTYYADYLNLKFGCDFGGFINNTTFSVNYTSANVLNAITDAAESSPRYAADTKYYNVKMGTLDVGCKITL